MESEVELLNEKVNNFEGQLNNIAETNVEALRTVNNMNDRVVSIEVKYNEVDKQLMRLGMKYDTLETNIKAIESNTSCLGELKNSIDKLTDKTLNLVNETKEQRKDIDDLKNKPASDLSRLKWIIVTSVVSQLAVLVFLIIKSINI